ncbi:hypothetical protein B0A48_15596 [Cryoendolithus antarcticus]|uniref:Uncharacterized protein n=1 Tax=Cryoendolithus antarcticus TaxID=1507870 RepID=A0A1V8SH09_9PEZI|nr:hypothetical protein B0A48_15596 [Cryoendolithus antarcticus]
MPQPSRARSSIGGSMRRRSQSWRSARHDFPFDRPHHDRHSDGSSDDDETIFPFDETISFDESFVVAGLAHKSQTTNPHRVVVMETGTHADATSPSLRCLEPDSSEDDSDSSCPTWLAAGSEVMDIMLAVFAMIVDEVHWVAAAIVLVTSTTPSPALTPGVAWKHIFRESSLRCEEAIVKSRAQNGGIADRDLEVCENATKILRQQEIDSVLVYIPTQVPASKARVASGVRAAQATYEAVLERRRQGAERVEQQRVAEEKRERAQEIQRIVASMMEEKVNPQLQQLVDACDQARADAERVRVENDSVISENLLLTRENSQLKDDLQCLVCEHQRLADEHRLL